MEKRKRKGRWLRRLLRVVAGFILLFIAACLVLDYFVQFRMSDEELKEFFAKNKVPAEVRYYRAGGRTMRYASMGHDSLPALLFIHGSPSSLSIYKDYYKDPEFLSKFKMYAVDRPGYGNSGLGNAEPSIQKQAEMIRPILDSLNKVKKPVIIMAGSYGTSIACRLAMDHPGLVDGLVLVAPSLAPGEETVYWFTPAVESPLVNWFIPRMLRTANAEKIHHEEELRKMLPYWQNIRIPVMYLQGDKDELIDTSNASFARRHLVNVPFLEITWLKGRKHFVAFDEQPMIRRKILEMNDRLRK
ncbi:MAG TPA: alpha/beta hydrolase [Flavisolibacter sp.]|jgi:pimeloyl-ACP methyl ester carboxylesterase